MSDWTLSVAERTLLSEAIRLGDARADRLRHAAAAIDDWPALAKHAERLAILGAVGSTLLRHGVLAGAPRSLAERWSSFVVEHTARNALLMDDAAMVAAAFEAAGVRALFMKGSALLATSYDDLGARHLDDVDVIVDADDIGRASECLRGLGFSVESRFERIAIDGRPLYEHMPEDHHSEVGTVSPRGTAFDLHKKIPEVRQISFKELFDAAEWAPWGQRRLRVPRPADHMRMICEHVIAHHDGMPRYWPRHIADMLSLERAYGAEVWSQSNNGAVALCRAALAWWVRDPVAASGVLLPGPRLQSVSEGGLHTAFVLERNLRDLFQNPRRVWGKLVPSRAFIADRYDVSAEGVLAPYYVHRVATLRFLRERESA